MPCLFMEYKIPQMHSFDLHSSSHSILQISLYSTYRRHWYSQRIQTVSISVQDIASISFETIAELNVCSFTTRLQICRCPWTTYNIIFSQSIIVGFAIFAHAFSEYKHSLLNLHSLEYKHIISRNTVYLVSFIIQTCSFWNVPPPSHLCSTSCITKFF